MSTPHPDSSEAGTGAATATSRPAGRLANRPVGELIFALLLLAIGLYCLVGVFGIRVPSGARVGPTAFPILVSVILIGSSVAVLIGVLRGQRGAAEEGEDVDPTASTDWLTLAKIVGLVVAHLLLIPLVGWAIAAAVLFGGCAWSLGAKRWWVAILVGLGIGLVLQIVFGELLGLSLPLGPALGWLGPIFGGA
jgi:putative tricarboxylic transport membrane protein